MAIELHDVKSYLVELRLSRGSGLRALITLSLPDSKLATLSFYTSASDLTPAFKSSDGTRYGFSYHIHELPVMIDLLRNEKPITLVHETTSGVNSYIRSGFETTGEGE